MKIIIPIIIIVAAIAGITMYSQNNEQPANDAVMEKDDAMTEEAKLMENDGDVMGKDNTMMEDGNNEAMMMEDEKEFMEKSGAYLEYDEVTISSLEGTIVLDFSASWCPSCRSFRKDVNESLDDIPAGLTIVRVDYDSNKDLRRQYRVTRQHTFVQIDNQGNKIALWSGSADLEAMVAEVQ